MDNQSKKTDIPMTDEELDQFLQNVSQQVAEPEAVPPVQPQRCQPKNKKQQKKQDKKQNRKKGLLYLALLLFFGAVFVLSAVYLIDYLVESKQQQEDYRDLANIVASIQANQATRPTQPSNPAMQPSGPDNDTHPSIPETEPVVLEILPEYKDLYALNNDLVGWIKIEDTKINYPVLQSDPENKDYYINHDFYHRGRGCGAIYVRETCDVFEPSDNVTIYGHHMKDKSMFAGLDYFRNQSFWEKHKTFTFDTLYEHHTYEVIAVFKTSANAGQGFPYHRFENAEDEADFDEFINTVKSLQMYETGVTAEYGDKLICLSTCEYTLNNGRLVLVAKRIT